MKERPILFSGEMVRAILDGRKTQTRRCVRHNENISANMMEGEEPDWCPYGRPGDRLWVRETWCNKADPDTSKILETEFHYRADGEDVFLDDGDGFTAYRKDGRPASPWQSPRFMPRRASRITLEITDVRVERVQDISTDDAIAEGISRDYLDCQHGPPKCATYQNCYRNLWDSINGKRHGCAWADNPWVWALTFKVITP